MGAAILDLTSWGPPSWIGSDVKNSIVGPILLLTAKNYVQTDNKSYTYSIATKYLTPDRQKAIHPAKPLNIYIQTDINILHLA